MVRVVGQFKIGEADRTATAVPIRNKCLVHHGDDVANKPARPAPPGRREVGTMPTVTCPTCGERGKIAPTLIGARIKCRKCGNSFMVAAPAPKATGATPAAPTPVAEGTHGIEVEG